MGNKASRRRDSQAAGAEAAATEQQSAEEPAASQLAEESGMTQAQEAIETEDLHVVVGEQVTVVACLPPEECTSECKEVSAAASSTQNDDEQEPVAKAEPQLLLSVSEPPPQPAPEPEPTLNPETEIEAVSEAISQQVPLPDETLEQHSDMLTQESPPEPVLSSPLLINLPAPDVSLQHANTPPTPVNADEPSDIPVTEECQDNAEAAEISLFEAGKPEETAESLEEAMETAEDLEQLVSDVNEDSISALLKNLELQGNDAELIPSDVKIPDDNPITGISTSTELM